jgi:hypothetical protein
LWASAAFLFLSTLFKSRAMSGVVFGTAGILLLAVLTVGRVSFFAVRRGVPMGGGAGGRADFWWGLAMVMTGCVATMGNLVLLAENRLLAPTENRVTPLRLGFLAQLLLIAAWVLTYWRGTASDRESAVIALGVFGGLHIALVAMFAVTEDLRVPRRVLIQMKDHEPWRWMLAVFRPGGGRGAAYVLAQMALLLLTASLLSPAPALFEWLLAICGYICCFSGVPALVWRLSRPLSDPAFHLRVAVLLLLALAVVLPEILYNLFWQPAAFDFAFGRRHLVNPFRTLSNWTEVERSEWVWAPVLIGITGAVAYLVLISLGARVTSEERDALAVD